MHRLRRDGSVRRSERRKRVCRRARNICATPKCQRRCGAYADGIPAAKGLIWSRSYMRSGTSAGTGEYAEAAVGSCIQTALLNAGFRNMFDRYAGGGVVQFSTGTRANRSGTAAAERSSMFGCSLTARSKQPDSRLLGLSTAPLPPARRKTYRRESAARAATGRAPRRRLQTTRKPGGAALLCGRRHVQPRQHRRDRVHVRDQLGFQRHLVVTTESERAMDNQSGTGHDPHARLSARQRHVLRIRRMESLVRSISSLPLPQLIRCRDGAGRSGPVGAPPLSGETAIFM